MSKKPADLLALKKAGAHIPNPIRKPKWAPPAPVKPVVERPPVARSSGPIRSKPAQSERSITRGKRT